MKNNPFAAKGGSSRVVPTPSWLQPPGADSSVEPGLSARGKCLGGRDNTSARWRDLGRNNQFYVMRFLPPSDRNRLACSSHRVANRVAEFEEEESAVQAASSVLLTAAQETALVASLETARFDGYGQGLWVHSASGCTVEVRQGRVVCSSPKWQEDVTLWVELELASAPGCDRFGAALLEYVDNLLHFAGEEAEPDADAPMDASSQVARDEVDVDTGKRKLPTAEDLGVEVNHERELVIYTWGDKLKTKAALQHLGSQWDINAKPLDGRGGGADTKLNALQDRRIMRNIASSMSEGRGRVLLSQALRKIEAEGLHCISVFCSKGRHRSVSMAELLRAGYYPAAQVVHLTIK